MTAATKEPRTVAAYGSRVIAVLEEAWAAIQENHPDLPDAVIITGQGLQRGGASINWGHQAPGRWTAADISVDGPAPELRERGTDEIMITGQCLWRGARFTMETLLHEAAHSLAAARGIQDTSRNNAYHNFKGFVAMATELGLEWPKGKPKCDKRGFSAVEITQATLDRYERVIDRLASAVKLYLAMPSYLAALFGIATAAKPQPEGDPDSPEDEPDSPEPVTKPKSRNLPKARCSCETPREIRLSRKMLDQGDITCGVCGSRFLIPEEDD